MVINARVRLLEETDEYARERFFNILCFFTVLYLSSVKVCQDSYKDRPVLQAVSRSVITKDPLMMDEARHLNNHAATHLSDPEAINSMLEQLEPGDTFDRNYKFSLYLKLCSYAIPH